MFSKNTAVFDDIFCLLSEFTPAETGLMLKGGKLGPEDINATLFDLCRKGYVIFESEPNDISQENITCSLHAIKKSDSQLAGHETVLFDWLMPDNRDGRRLDLCRIESASADRYSAICFKNAYDKWKSSVEIQCACTLSLRTEAIDIVQNEEKKISLHTKKLISRLDKMLKCGVGEKLTGDQLDSIIVFMIAAGWTGRYADSLSEYFRESASESRLIGALWLVKYMNIVFDKAICDSTGMTSSFGPAFGDLFRNENNYDGRVTA